MQAAEVAVTVTVPAEETDDIVLTAAEVVAAVVVVVDETDDVPSIPDPWPQSSTSRLQVHIRPETPGLLLFSNCAIQSRNGRVCRPEREPPDIPDPFEQLAVL